LREQLCEGESQGQAELSFRRHVGWAWAGTLVRHV
jgi:hypothetical protein